MFDAYGEVFFAPNCSPERRKIAEFEVRFLWTDGAKRLVVY
jgi:hypothetical protein